MIIGGYSFGANQIKYTSDDSFSVVMMIMIAILGVVIIVSLICVFLTCAGCGRQKPVKIGSQTNPYTELQNPYNELQSANTDLQHPYTELKSIEEKNITTTTSTFAPTGHAETRHSSKTSSVTTTKRISSTSKSALGEEANGGSASVRIKVVKTKSGFDEDGGYDNIVYDNDGEIRL